MDAVVALRSFIDAFDTDGLQQVKPLIPQLLTVFFDLMREVCLAFHFCHCKTYVHGGYGAFCTKSCIATTCCVMYAVPFSLYMSAACGATRCEYMTHLLC